MSPRPVRRGGVQGPRPRPAVTAVVEALAALNARLSPEDRELIVRCVVMRMLARFSRRQPEPPVRAGGQRRPMQRRKA